MAQERVDRCTLPKHIRPIHYDLQLEPDFNTSLIKGKAKIEVEFLEDTKFLTINAVDITVQDVVLTHGADAQIAKKIL